MSFKEEITIWSSPKFTKFDDEDTIKDELKRKLFLKKDIVLIDSKLKKDQGDIRVYNVEYNYVDSEDAKHKISSYNK